MAYEFVKASSQYLQAPSAVVTAAPLTMACWFYMDMDNTIANTLMSITNAGTQGSVTRFSMFAAGNIAGDPVRIIASNTSGQNGTADTTSGFSNNTWTHACGVFASSTSRTAYINAGSSATNTTSIIPTLLEKTNIGVQFLQAAGGTTGTAFANGRIAECGIWDAALTAAEIASLAKGMTCDKVRPQSLVFYAPLVRDLIDQKGGLAITNNNGATASNHPRVYA